MSVYRRENLDYLRRDQTNPYFVCMLAVITQMRNSVTSADKVSVNFPHEIV